jgi:2-polyprenyl-6-methoxyphenol hydroxylase-like FAD-dependent oxidoreductase
MANVGRILIVGGGIGGLSAAAAFHKVGLNAVVFEQAPELREAGAGVGLWSNAVASLEQLGAGEAVRTSCSPIRIFAITNPRGKAISIVNLDELGRDFANSACYIVLRPTLLAAIARCVPPGIVHTNARAIRIEPLPDRVRLHLADGRIEEGDLLVGADGVNSIARPIVVGPDAIRYSGQTCFRGVARIQPEDLGTVREIHGAGQRGSACPVDANTVYWWTAFNAPADQMIPVEKRRSFLLERYRGWPFGLDRAIEATPAEVMLQNDLIDRAPASRYIKDSVVLIGDAAHPTTPNLGQGANMAIDDAIVLARCLKQEAAIPAALARYERERLHRTRQLVAKSWNMGRMCLWKSKVAVWMRETTMRITLPWVVKGIMRWQILDGVGTL